MRVNSAVSVYIGFAGVRQFERGGNFGAWFRVTGRLPPLIQLVSICQKSSLADMTSSSICALAFTAMLATLASSSSGHAATITTLVGTGKPGYSGDGGPAAQAQLNLPCGLTLGPGSSLFICDTGNHAIRKVTREGVISTVAGTGKAGRAEEGLLAVESELNEPREVRFDREGNLFFVETGNHRVRRMDAATGRVSTVAGGAKAGTAGDGGPAVEALLDRPNSIQFDPAGVLSIADGNGAIRKLDPRTGVITSFRRGPEKGGRSIAFDPQGNLWVATWEGHQVKLYDFQQGVVHRMAGKGERGFTGDGGRGFSAQLAGPRGIAIAPNFNAYIADTENHAIRMIDRGNLTIERVAGTGERGDGPDGDPLTCKLARPQGVFVDARGTVLIADTEGHRVRVIQAR